MKDGELKIYFKGKFKEGEESAIRKFLSLLGFNSYAASTDLEKNIRDIAFDKGPTFCAACKKEAGIKITAVTYECDDCGEAVEVII